jgi:hypothetical protein
MPQALIPHPDSRPPANLRIEALAVREATGLMSLRYALIGDIAGIRVPERAAAARTDGLWRRTCFEAFLRPPGGEAYYELNLSPSTEWAAYRFDRYRDGMTPLEIAPPRIETAAGAGRLALSALVALDLPPGAMRLGLTAVVEAADGSVSYWALAHPPGKPDFHHPDCLALDIPPMGHS